VVVVLPEVVVLAPGASNELVVDEATGGAVELGVGFAVTDVLVVGYV
jgi:hypothetical protein